MQSIESMESKVAEIKQDTDICRSKTLEKLDKLYEVLQENGEENSEENTASASAEVELGG